MWKQSCACRKELQQLLFAQFLGFSLRALGQGHGVLWVLSQWVTSFLWVHHSCSPSEMCLPGVVLAV